jgi:hypothetical protein
MTTINRLSSVDALQPGDLIPVWDTSNGDPRKASLGTLLGFIEANYADPDYETRVLTPLEDFFTVTAGNTGTSLWLIINPVTAFTTGTLQLPPASSATNDQEITVVFTAGVTDLTVASAGATVLGAPIRIGAYDSFRVRYNAGQLKWYTLDTTGDGSGPTASILRQDFAGDGVTTNYTLAEIPPALGETLQIFIDGVYQERASYNIAGAFLIFSAPPPNGTVIEVLSWDALGGGTTTADLVSYNRDSGGVLTTVAEELDRTTTINVTAYELGTTAAASSHAGIITGHIIRTSYFDSARTSGSGAEHSFTGVTTLGKAGNWPDADGYFYDVDGRQFAVVGSPVNALVYGIDGVADDASFVAALNTPSKSLLVDANTLCTLTVSTTIPADFSLLLDGEITGAGNLVAAGSLNIDGKGKLTLGNVWALKLEAGSCYVRNIEITKGSVYGVYIFPTAPIDNLLIDGCHIHGCQYGVLRNNNAGIACSAVQIINNLIEDSTGDGIEWNVGINDERLSINNNQVFNTDGTIANSGLAIGVAGSSYTNDNNLANYTQYVQISNNLIKGARQGIHCEITAQLKISGNHISDVTAAYGNVAIPTAAIITYAVVNGMIDSNIILDCDSAITTEFGSSGGVYIGSPVDVTVSNNTIINSGISASRCAPFDANTFTPALVIKGNSLIDSSLSHIGACNLRLEQNTVISAAGVTGLTINYRTTGGVGLPDTYSPDFKMLLVAKNNTIYDRLGITRVSFTNITTANSWKGNLKLIQSGNNFNIASTDVDNTGASEVIISTTAIGVDGFPYGATFEKNTIVLNSTTRAMYLVTTGGSRNAGADNYAVFNAATGTIRSTNYPWATGHYHEHGQAITLNDGVAPLACFVSNIYVSGGFYKIDVVDSAGVAINLGALGSGSIVATNPVVYKSLLPTRLTAAATTLGTVVKKQEVFDADGVSQGFIPIYNTIT